MASIDHYNLTFHGSSLAEIYTDICATTVEQGEVTSPRGMKTFELICPTIIVDHPEDCLPVGTGRKPSLKIAAVEAVQLCGGFADADLTVAASREFERYQEPEGYFHGAYGRRIRDQAIDVVEKLRGDPDSRQAVVTLWDPQLDNEEGKRDYPCTVAFQFLVRDEKLVMVSHMRSNDVWLGLAYDLFQFGQLQWTIAHMLDRDCGPLVHRPVSLHAYERNYTQIEDLVNGYADSVVVPPLFGFTDRRSALMLGTGLGTTDLLLVERSLTTTERWFMDQLVPLHEHVRSEG